MYDFIQLLGKQYGGYMAVALSFMEVCKRIGRAIPNESNWTIVHICRVLFRVGGLDIPDVRISSYILPDITNEQ